MTIIEIENNLNDLIANFSKESFIFYFLLAYGTPKSTIKRLEGSDHDHLSDKGELLLRKKLFFKVAHEALHVSIDTLKTAKEVTKHSPRFIIVTDYERFLAYDTKTDDTLDTELLNITNHYDFFLPLAGMEKATFADENPADVKASLKMAKLYDELQKNNHFQTKEELHSLNIFSQDSYFATSQRIQISFQIMRSHRLFHLIHSLTEAMSIVICTDFLRYLTLRENGSSFRLKS